MHMHNEKQNNAINDSMSLLLATSVDEQDHTPTRMAMIHPYTYIYRYLSAYRYVLWKNCWLQVLCVYGTYPSLHIRQQETTTT